MLEQSISRPSQTLHTEWLYVQVTPVLRNCGVVDSYPSIIVRTTCLCSAAKIFDIPEHVQSMEWIRLALSNTIQIHKALVMILCNPCHRYRIEPLQSSCSTFVHAKLGLGR